MLAIHPASAPNKIQKIRLVSIFFSFYGFRMVRDKYTINNRFLQLGMFACQTGDSPD
jgi:hypothetical protein